MRVKSNSALKGLPEELADFADIFAYSADINTPLVPGATYTINLELGKKPPFRPLYNLSVKELKALREYLELALKNR